MTPLDLDAIKARHAALVIGPWPGEYDIPDLIAEVERLRASIVAARESLLEAEGWVDSGYEAGQLISEALGQLGTS